jgi:hypothetical protein
MPKHQLKEKSYKDPRFTTERVRELFEEVVEGYAGLGSEWHRRQIEDVFGGWEAKLILKALHEVHPQKLGAGSGRDFSEKAGNHN